MTRLTADWLNLPATQAVMDMLTGSGHQAYFVGGCVRNTLLNAPVSDIDIATDALPDTVMALCGAAGLKGVPTGIDHGTVTVISGGIPHEITTFRQDVDTDGRRAVVAFSSDIADDARRRDFTMNALYALAGGTLVDPLNGLPDLQARRVRFIEDAHERLREDYLRLLRFFRFHAWYGDPQAGLDAEGLAACAAHVDGLDQLSRERVGAEMLKLLAAPDPAPAMAALAATGGLIRVLPGADATSLPVLVALEQAAEQSPDPIRRLALLGAEDPATALRLSKSDSRRLALLQERSRQDTGPLAALAYRHGAQAASDIALIHAALMAQHPPADLEAETLRGAAAIFPVRAADLIDRFTGPDLGEKLADLENRWIASDFTLDRAALIAE